MECSENIGRLDRMDEICRHSESSGDIFLELFVDNKNAEEGLVCFLFWRSDRIRKELCNNIGYRGEWITQDIQTRLCCDSKSLGKRQLHV